MPRITAIKPQKDKTRVNVYVDGKFSFGIDLENFVKANIKIEKEISAVELQKLIDTSNFQKIYLKSVNFASIRPRSRYEVSSWMKRKKVDESIQKKLFKKLEKLSLLNDENFTKWWVEQRIAFRPRSKRALKMELRQKGVDRELVEKVLGESEIDEKKQAKDLYDKNKYKWERFDEEVRKKKAAGFLARKGFSWEVIKCCLD